MPILYPNGKVIFFAHVPKTGGSSVEDYLVRRFGSLSMLDRHKREGVRGTGLISPVTHLSALDLEEMLPPDLDLCFAVVRDPLKRMLSEYRWQQNASRVSRMDFSTWLRTVITAARREPRIFENHIRPQAEMIPVIAEIFRLEEGFDAMVTRLDAVTGTTAPEVTMGHLLKRSYSVPINIRREDAELVSEFYSLDYERFGYDKPDSESLEIDRHTRVRTLVAASIARALVVKQRWDWVR